PSRRCGDSWGSTRTRRSSRSTDRNGVRRAQHRMDDDMQAIEAGNELERLLALYARARLSPDPSSTAQTRARVMREARLSFDAGRIPGHVAPPPAAAPR